MEKLLAYLNRLTPEDREAFAKRCETTAGYLRKACSVNQRLGEGLCLRIGAESGGEIKPEDLRPDVDWQYLRAALANLSQTATGTVAIEAVVEEAKATIENIEQKAESALEGVAETMKVEIKHLAEEVRASLERPGPPWDGVTERRHHGAPDHINGHGI